MMPINDASNTILDFLKDFGFAFLMFLSGMEIDFQHLIHPDIKSEIGKKYQQLQEEHKRCEIEVDESCEHLEELRVHKHWHFPEFDINKKPYILGGLIFISTLGLSILSFYIVSLFHPLNYIFTGIMFSTTSVGLVFPILHELGWTENTSCGLKIIISSVIADFASMIALTIVIVIYTPGALAFDILLIPLLFLVFIAIYQIFRIFKKHPKWYSSIFLKETSNYEIKTTASIFLLLCFIILAFTFGIEMILGAFMAGAIISLVLPHEKVKNLYNKLHILGYGFLIPVFFILIGRDIHLGTALLSLDVIGFALIILGISFMIKIVPTFIFMKLSKSSTKHALCGGILQSSRLSLVIAAAEIGIYYGFFTEIMLEVAILVVIVTSILSPIVFAKIMKSKEPESICST
jgi:Kef-type K+ transport system membrane component KefB